MGETAAASLSGNHKRANRPGAKRAGKRSLMVGLICLTLGLGALGAGIIRAGGPASFFHVDPDRVDYSPLRESLARAQEVAAKSFAGTKLFGTNAAVDALQSAILLSRTNARNAGTLPIPEGIRHQLEPYFPAYILEKTQWTYPNRSLDLGSIIATWYRKHGGAVTLKDTIVYSDTNAVSQRYLWAHELTHVMQFEELGVANFARIYLTNSAFLEEQAWDNARQIIIAIQREEISARQQATRRAMQEQAAASEMAAALEALEAEAAKADAELQAMDEAEAETNDEADSGEGIDAE